MKRAQRLIAITAMLGFGTASADKHVYGVSAFEQGLYGKALRLQATAADNGLPMRCMPWA